jgi:ABC-type sugar transport system permease subunit/ABC-type glycerol-3-phosphate transport system substrate-binding protein
MGKRQTILLTLLVVVGLWLLHPSRQYESAPREANVVEITYMGPGGALSGAAEDAAREFERRSLEAHRVDSSKPIYRVISGQNAARDQTADPTRFLVSVAGGMPPDVIYFDRFATAEWAARGAFTPLDPFIERDQKNNVPDAIKPESFYPAAWDEGMFGGKVYGIPNAIDNRALLYNKDLLVRAGFVDEKGEAKPPRTWDELAAYTKALSERNEKGQLTRAGFLPNYGNAWLYMYGWMNDARFLSDDGRTIMLNSPEVVDALSYIKNLYDISGGYQEVLSFQAAFQSGVLDPFVTGKVAMKIDGFWSIGVLASVGRNVNFGVAPPPRPKEVLDSKGDMSWTGGWVYAIPATAKNKDAAWEFIRFMMTRDAISIRLESERAAAESEGRLFIPRQEPQPAINDWAYDKYIKNNPQMPAKFADAVRMYNDLLAVSKFRPVTPVGQLLWNEHVTSTETALYGTLSPQDALDEGTATVQRALDRFNAPPRGVAVTSWTWFIIVYAILLVVIAILIYRFDTRLGFRRAIYRVLPLPKKNRDAVVEGARGGYMRSQWLGGVVCASPWLIGFIIFGGGPMLFSLLISFADFDILSAPRLVGVDNYTRMFSSDRLFWDSLSNTLYMVIAVPLGLVASLGIALLLNQQIKAMPMWRTFFYLPAIVPMVAASVLWIWIFNPSGGLLNGALEMIGIEGPRWLQDADWSKPSLILMGLWGAGGGMIIWLAGLKSIPGSLYEAAEVDGANAWQQFWHVTIPQLTPYIFFNLIMSLIGTFQIFAQAYIMTQGGPVNSTTFYVYYLFNQAFRYGNMGYASAMAWVLFVIVLVITVFQIKFSKKWVHYGAD